MATLTSRPLRVFLCHSSDDKPTVRELYSLLASEGWIDAWLDEEKIYPGQDWNYEIEKAVKDADVILVCLTKKSVNKEGYVQRELRIILDLADYKPEGTLYIIPVRLEECEPPKRIRRWQYANYFPKSQQQIAYQRLLQSLKFRASHLKIIIDEIEEDVDDVHSVPPRSESVPGARTFATPTALEARLTVLQGVGSSKANSLAKLGLYTIKDMLYYYPRAYEEYSQPKPTKDLIDGMNNPDWKSAEPETLHSNRILPIYSLTEGITQKWLRNSMRQVVEYFAPAVPDALPKSVCSSAGLMPTNEALTQIHLPNSHENLQRARKRLVFDEIFYLQLAVLHQKREWKSVNTKGFSTTDMKLIETARNEAQKLFDKDAELSDPEHKLLADAFERFYTR